MSSNGNAYIYTGCFVVREENWIHEIGDCLIDLKVRLTVHLKDFSSLFIYPCCCIAHARKKLNVENLDWIKPQLTSPDFISGGLPSNT